MLSGNTAALANHQMINGFTFGDTISLTGFSMRSIIFLADAAIELANGHTLAYLTIAVQNTADYHITASSLGTVITFQTPCFASGTRILTSKGKIPVENLRLGETVITIGADDSPIIWIGKRTIDLQRHPHPKTVQPICIMANALAENVPVRDLWVSPDHAVYIEDYLIPAKELLNDFSIYQDSRDSVTYYHVELAQHAIIFAENAAVETYLETGNRAGFDNGFDAVVLHPDFGNILRRQQSCAKLLELGDALDEIRARILQRFRYYQMRSYA
jgi:collagen type I/II/III/V/XI/XXIV/XXVII alpha